MIKSEGCTGVVVIGDHVQALGIIRSLGRHGIPTYLLHDKNLCIGRFSRYLSKFIKMPNLDDSSEFIDFLINVAKKYHLNGWILMPTNDAAVKIISQNKEILEECYRVPTPGWEITKFALNKTLTYSIAEKLGIPTPKTFHFSSFSDCDQSRDIQYPIIVKGVEGLSFYKKTGVKAFKVNSSDDLKKICNDIFHLVDPSEIIIQELIPGNTDGVHSFCSFFKDGRAMGVWTGRKIREHPMGLGTATFAESIYTPEIIEIGSKILRVMGYYGISEIEFKKDPRDNKFKLIEMNARTWLWVSLAIQAGVDFPYMLYRDMVCDEIAPVKSFKECVRWLHIYTDLGTSFKEIVRGNIMVKDYLKSLKGEKEFAVFSADDMVPFMAETLMLPYLWIKR
jgi:predicted ATP-grasp superfamily ATP-dependent carboligase